MAFERHVYELRHLSAIDQRLRLMWNYAAMLALQRKANCRN